MNVSDFWTPLRHVTVGGLNVSVASRRQLIEAFGHDCKADPDHVGRARLIFDSNAHALSLNDSHIAYRDAMTKADVIHADGGIIVLTSKLLAAESIAERSCTTDMMQDFAEYCEQEGFSFFLLGGTEAVSLACADILSQQFPKLQIVGRRNGYFSADQEENVVAQINAALPDVLWVGLGKPKEQIFCAKHRSALRAGWAITCGGCFNYVTGAYPRAPKWMQKWSLEWVHRLVTNPKHLFWRYFTTMPRAVILSLTQTR